MSNSTEYWQSLTRTTRASVQSRIKELDTRFVAKNDDEVLERCQSLLGFVEEAWHVLHPGGPQYVPGNHIEFVARHLEAITNGALLETKEGNRLLVNVPPGTMKTLLVSIFWPAWEWGPRGLTHLQYIATSYREELTLRHSRMFRALVTSQWYRRLWSHVDLHGGAERRVINASAGRREAVPFGSLTGGRADRLILDDPNSVDMAESDADRERAALRFRESATTRLNDPAKSAIVVVMQRLHERDITGIIKSHGLPYHHIMLPMRFEPERKCVTALGEDWRTDEGELLFEARFPETVVQRDEKAMGSHAVAGQFQQRPAPRGGLLFKRHWLTAYTCGVLLGYHPPTKHFYIGHVVRDRVPNPEPMVRAYAQQDGKKVEISIPQDPGQAAKIQARSIIGACAGWTIRSSPESGESPRVRPFWRDGISADVRAPVTFGQSFALSAVSMGAEPSEAQETGGSNISLTDAPA